MKLNHTELRSFFYGTLLGDSYIHNGMFGCKQISEDLILFKKKIIEEHLPDAKVKLTTKEPFTDKNGVNHQKHYILTVSSCEYIKKLEKIFYPKGKKIIPKNAVKRLTPIGYAMWYADDGTTILVGKNKINKGAYNRRIEFCTDNFTKEENEMVAQQLSEKGFETFIIDRKRNNQYRIRIKVMDGQKLMCEIYTYFLKYFPSLLYKIDLGYRNESLENRKYVLQEYHNLYLKVSTHQLFKDRMFER